MGYVVKMPKLGLEMEQGTLLEWYVEEGDAVEEGEVLAEVESEKSIGEIDAREDGVLRLLDLGVGETVPPGTPIGIVAGADEDIADLENEFDTDGASAESAETETGADETAESSAESITEETDAAETASESADVKASPKAKRRADELGVDLTTVEGTGPQGAVTADDVEAATSEATDTTTTEATDAAETELHPQAEDLLHKLSEAGVPPLYRLSVAEARETYLGLTVPEGEPEPVGNIIDTEITGPNGPIPIRVYEPESDGSNENSQPALVFFHGGGWVIGEIATHDLACRALSNAADCVVASVAYRLAPEERFPAALEDCYAATKWLADNPNLDGLELDSGRIVVGGDSAGGTLATGVALVARDRDGPDLAHQLLVYPATNHGFDTESYTENANGYFITRDDMERFWDAYLETPGDGRHPYASPLGASNLENLPPTTVLTCGFDPLRDEGREYADRLEDAGVSVTRYEYDDMIHGFLTMLEDPEWKRAREAIDDLASDLRTAFEE